MAQKTMKTGSVHLACARAVGRRGLLGDRVPARKTSYLRTRSFTFGGLLSSRTVMVEHDRKSYVC